MLQHSQAHHTLLSYLRHELCTPINGMIGYSDLLLEALQAQPTSTLFEDLQKIRNCSQQLLTLVTTILDPTQLEMSQFEGDLNRFGSTLRMELITPLSTIIGYCEMLLEEAPAELISDVDKLHCSAQRLLSLVNDIVHLAQQQLETIMAEADSASPLALESPEATHLAQSAAATLEALNQTTSDKQRQGGMILVIDDNPTNCDLLARQLERQGYTVTAASNAQQALRLLQAVSYDLILLDMIMPGISGLDLLQQLKSTDAWRHIPVIMISALDEVDGAVKCIEIGAEDYLHKPCDPTLLKTRIGACLERKQLRDQEILYLQQVERLTTAAEEIEAKTFNPDNLNDLIQRSDKLSQLARVFQHMAQEVYSREQHLEHQLQMLQVSIASGKEKDVAGDIATTDHFRQLQKRTKSNLDVENLYRSSLYPSLSHFSPEGAQATSSEVHAKLQPVGRLEYPETGTDTQSVGISTVVAVHSFRGGTGKSSLTSNLAISMAKQGKRVGIIDTDLQSPGIHVLFGLDDALLNCTLNDYLWGDCEIYEATYDLSYVLQQTSEDADGAVYLVPASTKAADITRILREGYRHERLLDGFSDIIHELHLDFLLIDTHPGISEDTLQAIAACSLLVVILRPDYQDYQGTSVIVELARMLSVEEMLLVVNKALPEFDVEIYRQQLETAYGVSASKIVPFSEKVMHLASSDIFSVHYPEHSVTKAIDAIGQHIIGQIISEQVNTAEMSHLTEISTGT